MHSLQTTTTTEVSGGGPSSSSSSTSSSSSSPHPYLDSTHPTPTSRTLPSTLHGVASDGSDPSPTPLYSSDSSVTPIHLPSARGIEPIRLPKYHAESSINVPPSQYSNSSQLRMRSSPIAPLTHHPQVVMPSHPHHGGHSDHSKKSPTPSPPALDEPTKHARNGYMNGNIPVYDRADDPGAHFVHNSEVSSYLQSRNMTPHPSLPLRLLSSIKSMFKPKRSSAMTSPMPPIHHNRKRSNASTMPSAMVSPNPYGLYSNREMPRSRSTLFLHLLFFICGMLLTYIVLTSTQPVANVQSQALMDWFKQSSFHPSTSSSVGVVNNGAEDSEQPVVQALVPQPTTMPLCGLHDFADGEWVFDPTITKAPYVSHEWDNLCDADGYTNDGDTDTPPGPKRIRPELQWVWKPHNCRLAPYSRKNFCQLLAGRNILFAGDSIAGQHLSSFIHQLHTHPDDIWIRDEYFRHDVMTVCQDFYPADESNPNPPAGRHPVSGKPLPGIRVGFRRNNFLNLHTELNDTVDHRKWNTNQSWIGEIAEHNYEIVVINTGIWMVDAPVYREMLTDISSVLHQRYPNVTFIWRSTQPGHASCHTHWARPQKVLYDIRDTTGGSARFRWEEADERNRIAREFFPDQFLDVNALTRLRPDGHMPGECLHYCQPGPIDEWQKILFHRLALQTPAFLHKLEEESNSKIVEVMKE